MAEHLFILDGGFFYKMAPALALPNQTDLFGQPLGDSNRTAQQLHGFFLSKYEEKSRCYIMLKITGKVFLYDDVLQEGEQRQLESILRLECSRKLYAYPYKPGAPYLISTENITEL